MVGETEEQGTIEVSAEALILAEAIDNVAGGLHAIAGAINRLADATAGEEVDDDLGEVGFLDGKR